MKKIYKAIIMMVCVLCFTIFSVVFTGCGEQFIEERTYQLLNAEVIRDNAYLYQADEDGTYASWLVGGMTFDKCKVNVKHDRSVMTFDDLEDSGIFATFVFDRYSESTGYPAYKCTGYKITLNNEPISEEEMQNYYEKGSNLVVEVDYVGKILTKYESSLQLVTLNHGFMSHLILKDDEELKLMAIIYGY